MQTQTDVTREDLRQLVKTATNKERRILTFSVFFSMIAVVAGALWLWYAYNRVKNLDEEYAARVAFQQAQLEKKTVELNQITAAVAETKKELAQLQKDVNALKQFSADVSGQLPTQAVDNTLKSNPDVVTLLPRVYIQIGNEEQREKARNIQAALRKQGFLAPGIENVKGKAADQTYVKFFHETEGPEATQLAQLLQKLGVKASVRYIKGFEDSSKIRARHYEIWFGPDF